MKKGTNRFEMDYDANFQHGPIYIQQQDILHQKLDEIMKKNHVQISQIQQIKNMIHSQLDNLGQEGPQKEILSLDLLFEDCLWPFQFERKFLRRLEKYNNPSLIIIVQMILEGYFDKKYDTFETQLIEQVNPKLLTNYFIFTSQNIKVAILFEVGLKKYPVIEGYQQLRGFQIKHQITFIDIQQIDNINQLLESMKQYQIDILLDPYKQEMPFIYHEQEFLQNKKNVGPQEAFLYNFSEECWGELQFNVKQQKVYRWVPCQLPNYGGNMAKFIFYQDAYVTQNWIDIQEHKNHYRVVQFQNSDQMAAYADFESASNIIDFLTSIDECNIKPTEQEKQVISSDGNLMVIGRSGTGKTTCAILRLFAIHMMVRYKASLNNQSSNQLFKHSQIKSKLIGLHSLFTTQNLRLVQQVKKKYKQMLENLRQASIEQNLTLSRNQNRTPDQIENFENNKLKDMILDELAQEMKKAGFEQEKEVFKFTDYSEEDFPLFLSIKKLLFLIDNCLQNPFFQQQRFTQQDNIGDQAGWDDDEGMNNIKQEIQQQHKNNHLQMLEQNAQKVFQYGLMDQSYSQSNQKQEININEDQKIKYRNIRVVEVNYEIFRNQFWPTIQTKLKQKRDQDSFICLVWTHVFSYIKGSQFSHQYPGNYLPKDLYIKKLKSVLDVEKLDEIYLIFQAYEKWKDSKNYFDQMDIVNYLINCVEKNQYMYNPIHNTLIDEIQDLPHSTIKLLKKLTEQSLYCSGDTAQSISKGVGFRFQDLRPILSEQQNGDEKCQIKEVISHQLTINFRSHNRILQLANSIVSMIEIFFPKTIDKLRKEISDLIGPIPFVVESNKIQDLIAHLNNFQMIDQHNQQQLRELHQQQQQQQQQQGLNLGHDKVVIVKDNEAKNKLPKIISEDFICLTIAECKGLEYNDVIIWNFFCDQTISSEQWGQLNNLIIEISQEDGDVYESKITTQNNQAQQRHFAHQVQVKKLKLPQNIDFDPFQNQSFCLELKQLYVAVTRAKQRIIIFDEDQSKRQPIINLFTQLGVVKILRNNIALSQEDLKLCPELIQPKQNNNSAWIEQGFQLFQNKLYSEAQKCFRFAHNVEWQDKCSAYLLAQNGQKQKNEAQAKLQRQQTQRLNERENKQIKIDIQILSQSGNEQFKTAADIFRRHKQLFQAAQCYFSSENYQTAFDLFLEKRLYLEVADCAYRLKNYYLLSILLLKENYFEKSLELLERLQLFKVMLGVIEKFKRYFPENVYHDNLKKILPKLIEQSWNRIQEEQSDSTKYLHYFKQLTIHNKNDFDDEFNLFVEGYIYPKNDKQFLEFLFTLIKLNIKYIIESFQRSFLNYNILELQRQLQDQALNEYKIKFMADVLELLNLYEIRDYLIDYNFRKDETQEYQKFISRIFQCSRFITNQNNKATKQHNPKLLWNHQLKYKMEQKDVDLMVSALCVFGFSEQCLEYMKMYRYGNSIKFESGEVTDLKNHRIYKERNKLYEDQIKNFFNLKSNLDKLKSIQDQIQISITLEFSHHSKRLKLFGKNLEQNDKNPQYIKAKLNVLIENLKGFFEIIQGKYFQFNSLNGLELIIQFEDLRNAFLQDLVKLEIQDFFFIVKFLQYISSPFKRNSFVNGQSLLFNAMCIYYKIIIPDHQSFGFLKYYGSQYLWVDKNSPILAYSQKLNGYEQFECEDRFYMVSSNFVVKMISKHFKEILNTLVHNYKKQFEFPEQKIMKEFPFVVTVYTYISNKIMQTSNKLSSFQCPFYMKVNTQEFFASFHQCFKKQFEIYLEQQYQYSLNFSDLDILQEMQIKNIYSTLSIQYLMKAQGSSLIKQQVKQIRFAIQVNYLVEQNLSGILKKIQILQNKFDLNLQLNILRYVYEYSIFLVSNQKMISFDSLENFNNAYSQYFNERFYLQDQKITRLIILFSIPFIEKDIKPQDNFKAEFYLTQQQRQLVNSIFRDEIEVELQHYDKIQNNFENYFKLMFTQQNIDYDLIEQVCINAKWQKLLDVIIQQSNSSKLSRQIKENINCLIYKQKKNYQKYQKYQLQFSYAENEENMRFDEFLKIQISIAELNEIVPIFQLQIKEVDRSVIQSPALALVIRSYYPASNTFLSIIFNHKFLESFEMILQIRIKLLQFMFRFADDSLKFRSALITLADLYKLEKQLLSDSIYSELENQDHQNAQLKQEQINNLSKLNAQITELHKLIKDWEKRNTSYQEANNQIDRDYQLDPTLIQRRRRQQFHIQVNNLQNNQNL